MSSLAGSMFVAKLTGDKEIQKAMRSLTGKLQKKVLRAAVGSALRPMLQESKRMIPVESGALRDSMKISIKAFPPNTMVGKVWPDKKFVIGFWPAGSNKPERRRPIKYAHLIEGGHVVIRNGAWVGDVPPQPFIRDAFRQTLPEMVRRFRKSYLRGAKREWKKMMDTVPKKFKVA